MTKSVENQVAELQERLKLIRAEDLMTTNILTVKEDLSLAEVSDLMIKKRVSGLPVVREKDELVGIITATDLFTLIDIIRSGSVKEDALNPKVSFAMSTNILSIEKSTTLDEIITLMKRKNIHTLPVCEHGKMVGIIGRRDVFKNFYATAQSIAKGQEA
ncbi:MAG: CBS domain-containing protein [Candidatus Omnitrophota bacterium]